MTNTVGIQSVSYQLPATKCTLPQLAAKGLLSTGPTLLRSFGFKMCHLLDAEESMHTLAMAAARKLLAESQLPPTNLGRFFFYSGISRADAAGDTLDLFVYPATRMQHELGLDAVQTIALSQQGCCGLLAMIQLAADLVSHGMTDNILCVTADALPAASSREIMYNVMSDAAAAVLVKRDAIRNRIVHYYQHAQPYYWNTPEAEPELTAAYFPLAQRVIMKSLEQANLNLNDIRWIIPNNVSVRSWEILAGMLDVSKEKVWMDNIGKVGHTVSSDHVINLCDMQEEGLLTPGDLLLLFTFGFGASWSCLIIEH